MAIEVVTGHSQMGAEMVEKYDAGESISVDDGGHLLVRAGTTSVGAGKVIAVFAPKHWAFARVAEAPAAE